MASFEELPELVLSQVAQAMEPADRLRFMAASIKAARACMGCGKLALRVDNRVKWTRLKQVRHLRPMQSFPVHRSYMHAF